jgi:hypothetical protein
MNSAQTFHRWGKRVRIPLVVVFLATVVIACCIAFFPHPFERSRIAIVVASSPVSIWSWDIRSHSFVVITIPSSYVTDATRGYGRYSLDALWKLGFLDKKDGSLLAESLGNTLGIAIPWYIGEKTSELPAVADPVAYGRSLLSLTHMASFLLSTYRTNIPFSSYVFLARELASVRVNKITHIDLANTSVTQTEDLPDGTNRQIMNIDDIDGVLKGVFEDEFIRKEGITVALYNTTRIPSLGNQVARILSSYGSLVVSVGNDENGVKDCTLVVDKRLEDTVTVRLIKDLFDCHVESRVKQKRADVEMFIGTTYADQFAVSKL